MVRTYSEPGRNLHHSPGMVGALPNDGVQIVIHEAIVQNVLDRWT